MIGKRVMERAEAAFEPRPVGANAVESQHQYANLYFQRLVAQRPRVEAAALKRWAGDIERVKTLDVEPEQPGAFPLRGSAPSAAHTASAEDLCIARISRGTSGTSSLAA